MNCKDDLTDVDLANSAASEHLGSTATSSNISLYPFIDIQKCHGLNLAIPDSLPRVLRALDTKDVVQTNEEADEQRQDDTTSTLNWSGGAIDSQEDDDEILVHIRFSELVRVKSILIGTGGGRSSNSPRLARCWVNRVDGDIDFSSAQDVKPEQEWELLEAVDGSKGAVEYPVRANRFANVSELDLFFANSRSGTQSRLFYLGFMGESRTLKKEAGDRLAIGAEQGMGNMVDGAREEKPSGQASVR
ncbi:hypothetical protein OIO90_002049 [Microbotryomycetes sp. JL221]|nr:hypothetical protein OIO90_002049 [Microbotryomycetes sp. JL221]